MVDFPSLDFVKNLQQLCNQKEDFRKAAEWSDVNVVYGFGDQRYWLKLYGGKIIDLMEYVPMSNALGYDVIVSGEVDAWSAVVEGTETFWQPLSQGSITIEGNRLEANRIHEAICIIGDTLQEVE